MAGSFSRELCLRSSPAPPSLSPLTVSPPQPILSSFKPSRSSTKNESHENERQAPQTQPWWYSHSPQILDRIKNLTADIKHPVPSDRAELFCICLGPGNGRMIECGNKEKCLGHWFHFECVGMDDSNAPATEEEWFCNRCVELRKGVLAERKHVSKWIPVKVKKAISQRRVYEGEIIEEDEEDEDAWEDEDIEEGAEMEDETKKEEGDDDEALGESSGDSVYEPESPIKRQCLMALSILDHPDEKSSDGSDYKPGPPAKRRRLTSGNMESETRKRRRLPKKVRMRTLTSRR